jgi:hypothetical protein
MTIEIDGVNNTLKTDKIEPQSGTALTVGTSGDTVTVPTGVGLTVTDEVKTNKVSPATGTALQISDSGDTVTLPSGATLTIAGTINASTGTATGFGGSLDWQTSDIKTSTFTAVAAKGYLVNTTGGAITVNLPAASAGNQIGLVDYAGTWDSNNVTLSANGSEKLQGSTSDLVFSRDREALQILYVDSTQGWVITSVADQGGTNPAGYVTATGGTVTTSGDFKIHTFNSSGTFTVSDGGNSEGSNTVDYLVVAGGGGGGYSQQGHQGGGGGAGGMRQSYPNPATGGTPVSSSPGSYPITVGGGGTKAAAGSQGSSGSASSGLSIPSAGGGGAGSGNNAGSGKNGVAGGSGGGGGSCDPSGGSAGAGNTPPVSPSQGNPGGAGATATGSSGSGGGHGGAGDTSPGNTTTNPGGPGTASTISGSTTTYSTGGASDGGPGTAPSVSANEGNGGKGAGGQPDGSGSNGGSGIVVIRYKYQN